MYWKKSVFCEKKFVMCLFLDGYPLSCTSQLSILKNIIICNIRIYIQINMT